MSVKVSIVIPSFNRYPLNLLCLYALEKQSIDLRKMQVILIDDASTDRTRLLAHYNPPYPFQYIINHSNAGIAGSRNKGLLAASGKVIIFLDADMIVDPDYVKRHIQHHLRGKKNVVIGGWAGKQIFTVVDSSMDSKQLKILSRLYQKEPLVRNRLNKQLKINRKISSKKLLKRLHRLKKPIQVVHPKDLDRFKYIKAFSIPKKNIIEKMSNVLGKNFTESPIAWMACLGNISIKKQLIEAVGGYDNEFKGWGTEDTELGYRLYKAGARFIVDSTIIRYHQVHPHPPNKKSEWEKNRMLIQKKHPVLDVCIRSLSAIRKKDFVFMDQVIREYQDLTRVEPYRFQEFHHSLVILLQEILILKSKKAPIRNLLKSSEIELNSTRSNRIFEEHGEIKSFGKYSNLTELFDLLIRL